MTMDKYAILLLVGGLVIFYSGCAVEEIRYEKYQNRSIRF